MTSSVELSLFCSSLQQKCNNCLFLFKYKYKIPWGHSNKYSNSSHYCSPCPLLPLIFGFSTYKSPQRFSLISTKECMQLSSLKDLNSYFLWLGNNMHSVVWLFLLLFNTTSKCKNYHPIKSRCFLLATLQANICPSELLTGWLIKAPGSCLACRKHSKSDQEWLNYNAASSNIHSWKRRIAGMSWDKICFVCFPWGYIRPFTPISLLVNSAQLNIIRVFSSG